MTFFPFVGTQKDKGAAGFLHRLETGLHRHTGHWRYSALVDFGTVLVLLFPRQFPPGSWLE